MRLRKQFFTLIEVIISLGLTLMILTVLLGAYFQAEKSSVLWQNREKETFPERYLQHRLAEVFQTIGKVDQTETFFFTLDHGPFTLPGTPSLVFTYNNGTVMDPALSGQVLGRLYVNKDRDLSLVTFTDRESWIQDLLPPLHREVLLKDVQSLQFEFFQIAPDKEASFRKDGWPKDLKYAPGAIKLTYKTTESPETKLIFTIPQVLGLIKSK